MAGIDKLTVAQLSPTPRREQGPKVPLQACSATVRCTRGMNCPSAIRGDDARMLWKMRAMSNHPLLLACAIAQEIRETRR